MNHPSIRMKQWNGAVIVAVNIDEPPIQAPPTGREMGVSRGATAVGANHANIIRHRGHLLECHRDCQEKGRPHA